MRPAVLFARRDSVYKTMGVDVYDIDRDARRFGLDRPVVAHPPCRAWGRFRKLSKPRPDEKDLARFAVDVVRRCGGVLEHPESSALWADKGLPRPGEVDAFGGFTLPAWQYWWGHKANKATWFYIVGIRPQDIPPFPIILGEGSHVVASSIKNIHKPRRPELSKKAREETPPALAAWLIDLASRCEVCHA